MIKIKRIHTQALNTSEEKELAIELIAIQFE